MSWMRAGREWKRSCEGSIVEVSHGLRLMKAVRCAVRNISQAGACLVADSEVNENDFY
jgi:hypothetical protein